jgi:hypothetical protein
MNCRSCHTRLCACTDAHFLGIVPAPSSPLPGEREVARPTRVVSRTDLSRGFHVPGDTHA